MNKHGSDSAKQPTLATTNDGNGRKGGGTSMKITTAKKGSLYESVETDLRALLNNTVGSKFLDINNTFKTDTEIVFVKKRGKP